MAELNGAEHDRGLDVGIYIVDHSKLVGFLCAGKIESLVEKYIFVQLLPVVFPHMAPPLAVVDRTC